MKMKHYLNVKIVLLVTCCNVVCMSQIETGLILVNVLAEFLVIHFAFTALAVKRCMLSTLCNDQAISKVRDRWSRRHSWYA